VIRGRIGLIWLVSVAATWLLTTAFLAALGERFAQSSVSALLACVVIAGPATAAALQVRRHHGFGRAALSSLVVAAATVVFICSFMAASGAALHGIWSAVTPALMVTVVQLGLALAMPNRTS
jgi:uncharacterized membrane protein YhaH (DUF805 family)